ncbi:29059_t:CDS:2 [Gigaspora margarita]|uniref:29059_t:CDS:1 n=1 Tax=Gigaspora margarita TaxID=4874 RepID=A0ABM8VVU4_GIGMA|nr:29059_t:CDS:2 [Gigaspora margarita]
MPLLWSNSLRKARSDAFRVKIIDIYLSCLNKEEQKELDELLAENGELMKNLKSKKPSLFSYVNFLQQYDFYETREDAISMRLQSIISKLMDTQPELKEFNLSYIKEDCLRYGYETMPIKSSSRLFIVPSMGFQTLYKLSLCSIIFTKNALKNLASLSNLEFLSIEYSSFEEEGQEIIGNYTLPKLQSLELKKNSLTINKFLIRIKYETLKTLNIIFTNSQIENEGLNKDFFTLN